jgi:hypothetical protein
MHFSTVEDIQVNPPVLIGKSGTVAIITATPTSKSTILVQSTAPLRSRRLKLHAYGT